MNARASLHELVAFRVFGTVRTNERHRHGQGRTWTPARTNAARREIVQAFREEEPGWTVWEGPVELTLTCVHQTPKSGWPGQQCNRKPDLDNVVKLVGDALNGVAYRDDAQIAQVIARKHYGDQSGIVVELRFLPEPVKPQHGWVNHPTVPDTRQLFEQGRFLGLAYGKTGKYMVTVQTIEQMQLPMDKRRSVDPVGPFRTLADAEAAIRKAARYA